MAQDDAFGAGIKLDSDWDIEVDNTGDLATTSGLQELEKDVAMIVSVQLQEKLGTTISSSSDVDSMKQIELLVKRLLQSDDRVRRVRSVEVKPDPAAVDTISVQAEVIADDNRDYELIIGVNE